MKSDQAGSGHGRGDNMVNESAVIFHGALFVNVSARMAFGSVFFSEISEAILAVNVLVLPVPGPAWIKIAGFLDSTACF